MGQIVILNTTGHQTIEWNPDDEKSVAKAEGAFEALKQEGYEFFEAETRTVQEKGKAVKSFKRTLGKIIAAPGTSGRGSRSMGGGPPEMTA